MYASDEQHFQVFRYRLNQSSDCILMHTCVNPITTPTYVNHLQYREVIGVGRGVGGAFSLRSLIIYPFGYLFNCSTDLALAEQQYN